MQGVLTEEVRSRNTAVKDSEAVLDSMATSEGSVTTKTKKSVFKSAPASSSVKKGRKTTPGKGGKKKKNVSPVTSNTTSRGKGGGKAKKAEQVETDDAMDVDNLQLEMDQVEDVMEKQVEAPADGHEVSPRRTSRALTPRKKDSAVPTSTPIGRGRPKKDSPTQTQRKAKVAAAPKTARRAGRKPSPMKKKKNAATPTTETDTEIVEVIHDKDTQQAVPAGESTPQVKRGRGRPRSVSKTSTKRNKSQSDEEDSDFETTRKKRRRNSVHILIYLC